MDIGGSAAGAGECCVVLGMAALLLIACVGVVRSVSFFVRSIRQLTTRASDALETIVLDIRETGDNPELEVV